MVDVPNGAGLGVDEQAARPGSVALCWIIPAKADGPLPVRRRFARLLGSGLPFALVLSAACVAFTGAFVAEHPTGVVGRTWPGAGHFENSLAGRMLAALAHFEQPAFRLHTSSCSNRRNATGGIKTGPIRAHCASAFHGPFYHVGCFSEKSADLPGSAKNTSWMLTSPVRRFLRGNPQSRLPKASAMKNGTTWKRRSEGRGVRSERANE
jgi:hypothetical protein